MLFNNTAIIYLSNRFFFVTGVTPVVLTGVTPVILTVIVKKEKTIKELKMEKTYYKMMIAIKNDGINLLLICNNTI